VSALAAERYVEAAPFVAWEDFRPRMEWCQGEHVTLVGPTGSGKTTLVRGILPIRSYVMVFANKPRDPVVSAFREDRFKIVRAWPPPPAVIAPRVVFWPPTDTPGDVARHKELFRRALSDIYTQGSWTVCLNELRYVSEYLGLGSYCELLWQQGRSLGISVVGEVQRPRFVPLMAYDQATHLFFWRDNDRQNLSRIADLNATVDTALVRTLVANLPRYEVLYVNTRTGEMMRTKMEGGIR
jgi:energy-coupling factor transporter ATP-binding protein EcfA2